MEKDNKEHAVLLDGDSVAYQAAESAEWRKQIERQDPACPYCGTKPVSFLLRQLSISGYLVGMVFCANDECNKLLPVQVLAIPQPRVIAAPVHGTNGKVCLT